MKSLEIKKNRILVYGIGNPGRKDDGLGFYFAKEIELRNISNLDVDFNYQLNVEDACTIADYDFVFFVDASMRIEVDFSCTLLTAIPERQYTTHDLSPQAVLYLCQQIYHKTPVSYLIEIKGHEWELDEGLTKNSKIALSSAIFFFESTLSSLY